MNARILLVEDNEQNRYVATFLLEAAGHRVIHSPNGRVALDLALAHRPDLVLMDIQMPEMDGYEAAARMLATASLADVPIIAVTSYAMAGDRERALKLGFSGYLEKPVNPDTFVADVNRFLRERKSTP
jgi:two-component system, cell cycle response regulator DivK